MVQSLSSTEPLLLKTRDPQGVVTLTLNRPQSFNALSEAMLDALQTEIDALAQDKSARVLVIAATGRAFCAGHDLKEILAESEQEAHLALFARCTRVMLGLQQLPIPVIAQVQGIATAAGCQLVAMCDLAVAADDARLAVSGINLGLFCATPSVALTRNLARKAAFEMLLTGDFISARQALEKGLVNRVVPAAQLQAEVAALAASIVSKPQLSIARGKELFYRQLEMGIAAAYTEAGYVMACNLHDAPAQEGIRAFTEKRRLAN